MMKKLLLLFTLIASVALLAACEEPGDTVTVSFSMDGAAAVQPIVVPVGTVPLDFEALATAYATVPTRGFDIFVGWFTNSARTQAFDPSVALTQDVTIYAKFDATLYTRAQTYVTTTSEVTTFNPLNTSEAAASDLYGFLTGDWYVFDFDWAKAVGQGVAPAPYDFSSVADGTFSINALDYNYVLEGILASFPIDPASGESYARDEYTLDDGQYLDREVSRVVESRSWVYTLKPGLTFEDGRAIDADVVLYTIQQYIDPVQNNFRQDLVTSASYIDMVNSFNYFMQGKAVPATHPCYVNPRIPNPAFDPEIPATLPNPDYKPATIANPAYVAPKVANPAYDEALHEDIPATIANPAYVAPKVENPAYVSPTIPNPEYDKDIPTTIVNPDLDCNRPISATNPARVPNPLFKPATIENPLYDEELHADIPALIDNVLYDAEIHADIPATIPNPDFVPELIDNVLYDEELHADIPATIPNPAFDDKISATIPNPAFNPNISETLANPAFTTAVLYPAVSFSEVGIRKVSALSFEITSNIAVTHYDAIGNIGLINLVHPEKYEEGFLDATKAVTNYGSIDNPLVSYGPYTLRTWQAGTVYVFNKNFDYINADAYNYKSIRARVLTDQTAIVNEFKAGNVNVAGVSGQFFPEFKENPGLYIIPGNSAFRLAISLVRDATYKDGKTVLNDSDNPTEGSPLVQELAFRRALYFAIDRLEFAQEVFPPAVPNLGMVSSIHKVTMEAPEFFQESAEYLAMAEALGINVTNYGFDPEQARTLFDEAYANLVAAGTIDDGDVVEVDYTFGDSEVARRIAAWMKSMLEGVFNGTGRPTRIEIVTRGLDIATGGAFSQARTNGDFDLMLTGISGATYDAAFFSGFVYNNYIGSFLAGKGHNPGDTPVVVDFSNLFDRLSAKSPELLSEDEADALELLDDQGFFRGTFNEVYEFYGGTSVFASEYTGRTQDLNNLTVALEFVVLSQGINVPLYSTVSAVVYGGVYIDVPAWHSFLSFGGQRYRWLTTDPDFAS